MRIVRALLRGRPRIAAQLSAENQSGTSEEKCKFSVSRTLIPVTILHSNSRILNYPKETYRGMNNSCNLRNIFGIAQVSITLVIGISLQPLPNISLLQIFSKNLEKAVVLIHRRVCVRFLVVFLAFLIIILQRENLSPREPEGVLCDLITGGCNHLC